jgi:hypothetical protein
VHDVATPSQPTRPTVGRARELSELDDLLGRAAAGAGSVVMLTGEPGIGKTRLAATLAGRCADHGARAVWAACWDGGGAPAYWPWIQVLRRVLADARPAGLAPLAPHAAHVARLVPELAGRLPAAGPAELAPPRAETGDDDDRFRLFDAVAATLRAVAAQTPLLVVLDDLHDADASSLALLDFVSRDVDALALLLVGTYRDRGTVNAPSRADPAAVAPQARRLPLTGLEPGDVAQLVAARVPGTPPEALARELHRRTSGNPLFVDELLGLVEREGAPRPGSAVPLPAGVRDAIGRRLEPLGAPAGALLEVAAVVGGRFRLETVAASAGVHAGEAFDHLEEALAGGLVDEVTAPEPTFAFTHGLVRETIYDGLARRRRAELHAAVAEVLERRYAADPEAHLAEVAHHLLEALPLGDPARAHDLARRAGERALGLAAWEEAGEHLGRALALQERLDTAPEERAALLLALGRARTRAADPAARETLLAAASASRSAGDAVGLALAAVELGAVGLPPGDVDDEIVALLEEALEALDDHPTELRGVVLARLAVQQYWSPEPAPPTPAPRHALAEAAARILPEIGDGAAALDIGTQIHLATSGLESPARLARLDELLEQARAAGRLEAEAQIRVWRISAATQLGDLRTAGVETERFARLAQRLRQPRWLWYVPQLRAVRALVEGRLAEADELRTAAGEQGLPIPGSMAPLLVSGLLVSIRYTQRDLSSFVDPVTALADAHPAMGVWQCVRVAALLDAGRHAEAQAVLEQMVGDDGVALAHDVSWIVSCVLLADSAVRLGDERAAGPLLAALEPHVGRNATLASAAFLGPVGRPAGALASLLGGHDAALGHLAGARRAAERGGMRAVLAWIALDEAAALLRRGAPGDAVAATAALHEAQALGAETGLDAVSEQARALLGETAGVTPAGAGAAAAAGAGDAGASLLREGDVWTLALDGRTVRVRHAKGVEYLATLLEQPGVEVHALDLVGVTLRAAAPGAGAQASDAGLAARAPGDDGAGPALDAQAKASYRARAADLRSELDEAEAFNDPERAARAREELDFLAAELAGAVGLHGRDRPTGSSAERARVNVTRAIRSVLRRVAEHDAGLGQELQSTIRTGTYCAYRPDPRRPLRWRVERT